MTNFLMLDIVCYAVLFDATPRLTPTLEPAHGRTFAQELFDTDGSGTISFDEFRDADRRFPHLLWPAFKLQERMQQDSGLGVAYYQRIIAKRCPELCVDVCVCVCVYVCIR